MFEKLRILIDQLQSIPKILQDLTSSIRDAAESNRNESDRNQPSPVEVRLPENLERQRRSEQYQQATIQKVIAGATVFAALGAWVYAGISYRQLQALKDQTTYAERAWVNVIVDISGPLEYKEDGAHIPVAIRGQNLGRGPASDVQILPFVTNLMSPDYSSGKWEGQKYLERVKKFKCPFPRTLGRTLVRDPRRPGQTPPSLAGSKSPTHATG